MIATILPLLPTPYPLHAKHGALIQRFPKDVVNAIVAKRINLMIPVPAARLVGLITIPILKALSARLGVPSW